MRDEFLLVLEDSAHMIQKDKNITGRSRLVCQGQRGCGPVVYWMERDLRLVDNWALLFAQQEALIRKKPLHILLAIEPETLIRPSLQTSFKLHGIGKLSQQSPKLNIKLSFIAGKNTEVVAEYSRIVDCHLLVTDFSPLRNKKKSLVKIAQEITSPCIEVDAHNVIPAWLASPKKEYGAYTIRPKIHRILPDYLTDFPDLSKHPFSDPQIIQHNLEEVGKILPQYNGVECGKYIPGPTAAEEQVRDFILNKLSGYDKLRNNPNVEGQSGLSPYLHFGQLSPQRLAYLVFHANADQATKEVYLEELIVRRELADNYCLYEDNYDTFAGFHPWAQKTLNEHREDIREHSYTLEQLENAKTHEELWNSCQRDLVNNNKLHGFLRMYWAKKILEWTVSPEEALYTANYLNDKYSIDGSDPNGYTGTAWSIGGVHDRAWAERNVFGKIRYMNERGCRRKFNVDEYTAVHADNT